MFQAFAPAIVLYVYLERSTMIHSTK